MDKKKVFILIVACKLCLSVEVCQAQAIMKYANRSRPVLPPIAKHENPFVGPSLYITKITYADPKALIETMRPLFPQIPMSIDARTRSLTVLADSATYKKISKVIETIDIPSKQIHIEVKVIEVGGQFAQNYQSLFSDLTSGFKVNFDFAKNQLIPLSSIEGTLMAMIKKGDAKMLSKPTISTLDNSKASFKVGDQIPYLSTKIHETFVSYDYLTLDTGITLDLTPKITTENQVQLDILAQVATVKLWKDLGPSEYPVVSNRKTETRVYLKNEQTLMIMGLLDEQNKENTSKIPILGDIPWIGGIFRSKSEEKVMTDVVVLVRVDIQKEKALE